MFREVLFILCLRGMWAAYGKNKNKKRPNILVFLLDDTGIGDLEPFGNKTVPMPNLARLCKEGAKLDQHTTPHVICTPSRAAFLTGRYAVRSGMSAGKSNSPQVIIFTSSTIGLPSNETSFGTIGKKSGYKTGYVGKWHLGLNALSWGDMEHGPLGHGFDYFYGLPYTLVDKFERNPKDNFLTFEKAAGTQIVIPVLFLLTLRLLFGGYPFLIIAILTVMFSWLIFEHFDFLKHERWWGRTPFIWRFLNSYILENNEVVQKPIDLPSLAQRLTDASLGFIKDSMKGDAPFLLVHAFTATHTPIIPGKQFEGKSKHGKYGDLLLEVDDNIGQIIDLLRYHEIENDTVVYFASDHGADLAVGTDGGYNGPFRGTKTNGALEGGMRIPGILKWPGVIKPGKVIKTPTSSLDFLPTLAEISGYETAGLKLDGQSLLPIINNNEHPKRSLFHFCDYEIFAMRTEFKNTTYKLMFKEPQAKRDGTCGGALCPCYEKVIDHRNPLLYDIMSDQQEMKPIDRESGLYKDKQAKMSKDLVAFKADIAQHSMQSQFDSFWGNVPVPWLQPYLNV